MVWHHRFWRVIIRVAGDSPSVHIFVALKNLTGSAPD